MFQAFSDISYINTRALLRGDETLSLDIISVVQKYIESTERV